MTTRQISVQTPPPRIELPGLGSFALWLLAALVLVYSANGVGFSLSQLINGLPDIRRILSEMFPPDFHRLGRIGGALLETFQMALVGTSLGVLASFLLAPFASRVHSPHPVCYAIARGLVSLFRTVPDLIWALLFVVAVGLGPFAGTLAIMIDAMGFCGRFFAEAMEETHPGPQEALRAMGARQIDTIFCSVVPAAIPSFVNSALFSLEKATRSSVILGLVGAGGIGIELKVAMDLFQYDQAATAILAIFVLVIAVEQLSGAIRRRLI
jgi:phosphonate transport system permease protein